LNRFLYYLAIVLLVSWLIGAFVATLGKLIHLFLLFAIIVLLIRGMRKDRKIR
jgi:hypothetical protein